MSEIYSEAVYLVAFHKDPIGSMTAGVAPSSSWSDPSGLEGHTLKQGGPSVPPRVGFSGQEDLVSKGNQMALSQWRKGTLRVESCCHAW